MTGGRHSTEGNDSGGDAWRWKWTRTVGKDTSSLTHENSSWRYRSVFGKKVAATKGERKHKKGKGPISANSGWPTRFPKFPETLELREVGTKCEGNA